MPWLGTNLLLRRTLHGNRPKRGAPEQLKDRNMTLHERIRQLFAHHGIERAHFVGGGFVRDLIDLSIAAPDLVASLTLVCPFTVPQSLARDVVVPLSIVSGDRGKVAEAIDRALANASGTGRVVLTDCEPLLWTDVVAERTDEIRRALLASLAPIDREIALAPARPADATGVVAGLAYRSLGAGPPLVLFPLGLAASQWRPLLDDLAGRYAVVSISGAHTAPTSILEDRAANPGYQAVVASVMDRVKLAPGERLLEVGCGCGAVSRWLAERTHRANPIMGVDINRFLLSEAEILRDEAGLGPVITFMEGDAHGLPLADASFDAVVSITMLEEVDADRALAEMVRVTRPGGQVGIAIRALDMDPLVGADLPQSIMDKVRTGLRAAGAGERGCADASLYRRMAAVGLTRLSGLPQFNCAAHLQPVVRDLASANLDSEELDVWTKAVAAVGEAFLIAMPMHAAIGTKPLTAAP
jgi:SAM-dependent methyltransferase